MDLPVSVVTLAKQVWKEFGEDNIARLGAAFAYYTFTAFFPLMLVLVALVGVGASLGFETAESAQEAVVNAVTSNLPAAGPLLENSFQETEQNAGSIGFWGIVLGLWTASSIFAQLEESFNIIYDVAPRERSFLQKLKGRAQAATIVIAIAALMIGSFVFSAVIATVQGAVEALPGGEVGAWLLNIAISLTLSAVVFAALFKFLPDKPVTWKAAFIGGAFTSVTWQIGREVLTWYLGTRENPEAGAVIGAALGFLLLVYYASQILMFGAQVTATYDEMANPDLVAPKTSEDSALRGPGQPSVLESGKTAGRAESDGAVGSGGESAFEKRLARRDTAKKNVTSFGVGFVTGVAALFVGARKLVERVADRVR